MSQLRRRVEVVYSPKGRGAIAAVQGPEIETMTSWLEKWGEEVPSGTDHAAMATGAWTRCPG